MTYPRLMKSFVECQPGKKKRQEQCGCWGHGLTPPVVEFGISEDLDWGHNSKTFVFVHFLPIYSLSCLLSSWLSCNFEKPRALCHFFFFFFSFILFKILNLSFLYHRSSEWITIKILFLLDIFFIYISNAIPKVPYTLPLPYSPTHPLPLPGPGIPLYWGI